MVYLRYVFAYLLMFCKFFAYLLMFCKFCPCIVILALKYRIYGNTKSNFVVILSKSDGKEIPDLQVLSFE